MLTNRPFKKLKKLTIFFRMTLFLVGSGASLADQNSIMELNHDCY